MKALAAFFLALPLVACGEVSRLPETAQTGPQPELPAPQSSAIPTVRIAPAKGWAEGAAP
jgi:hypothetical protein